MQDQQIDSSAQMGGQISEDAIKNKMRDVSNTFMNLPEVQKRIRGLIGRSQRLNVSIDEVRHFDGDLAKFIAKNPIDAIKIFEDSLNSTVKGMQDDGGKGNSEKQQAQSSDVHFPKKVPVFYFSKYLHQSSPISSLGLFIARTPTKLKFRQNVCTPLNPILLNCVTSRFSVVFLAK